MLFLVSCSGGPLAGKAVATVDSCSFIEQNEQLFTESEALTVNNIQEDVVVRQGSSLTLGVEENTLIAPTAYLLKNCQEPVQAVPLRPTAESKLSSGWIVNQRNPEAVGAMGTVTVDQTFEAGKKHVLFVYSCRWIEEEEEKGWDCHGDDENPSKWMMISFTVGSCTDGVKNDDEADVDCGGSCGSTCTLEQNCRLVTDCQRGLSCSNGQCVSACGDRVQNNGETDVDCGGPCGSTCVLGQRCNSVATTPDCQAGLSCGVSNTCTLPCTDGRLTIGETDVDCGGSCGASCIEGKACQQNTDCQQGWQCNAQKKCAPPPRPPRFWAVGQTVNEQRIYHSDDGGKNWKIQYTAPGRKSLQDITFPDKRVGYAVGPQGKILKTTDAGKKWQSQVSGTTADLYGIDCVDHTRCWVVGGLGTILYTEDGGASWAQQISGTERQFEEVFFSDEFNGWIVGKSGAASNDVLHTTDGGYTWVKQPTGTNSHFDDIQCLDQNCWIVGSGVKVNMMQTVDGGASWTPIVLPNKEGLKAIQFVTFATGYVAGDKVALKTTDGGLTWQPLNIDPRWRFNDLFFVDENTGCGAGYTGGRSARIYCTSDGGRTWNLFGEQEKQLYFFYGITGRS